MINEKSLAGHAVVVGAGVMGAGIAALLANSGWTVDLLDVDAEAAKAGLDRALTARPPHFAVPEYGSRVRPGSVADDLYRAREAAWVVEAVAEDPGIKRELIHRLADAAGPETVVSSNTSGLSLTEMVAECPPEFQARFLGVHFFNPPRYMKPLELIPTRFTSPEVFEGFARFVDRVLGKRVIPARDTPGFISTRLGMYAVVRALGLAIARGLTVEEADYLTGPLIGRPKSGIFRLADIIGLDITARIIDNLRAALPHDPEYQALEAPLIMRRLVDDGRIGGKSGAGFYRREKSGDILSLDLTTGEYRPRIEPPAVEPEIAAAPLPERLRLLAASGDSIAEGFLPAMFRDILGYMARATPEVADRIVEVDDALIGGFGWEMGPFHQLDAQGEMDWDGAEPALVALRRESGETRFYDNVRGLHRYFDFGPAAVDGWNRVRFERPGRMAELPRPPGALVLKDLKKAGGAVMEEEAASLIDLGEGVACVEWRTKMNVMDPDLIAFIDRARERAQRDFIALVIGGSGDHFSAGFNLGRFVRAIESADWSGMERDLREFQQVLVRLKYAPIPVVSLAYGYTLGGGCETMLHADAVQAAFESCIGLPEANVGLIPAGGGATERLVRASAEVPKATALERPDAFPFVRPVWDTLRQGRFSSSADEARQLGFLRGSDGVTVHPDRLLHDARERARALAASYRPPAPAAVRVMAEDGLARFEWELLLLRRSEQISEHDARVARRIAWALCGGSMHSPAEVPESYLLDLEREAFLHLAGTPETLARIRHTLATGKPLRN